jgi:hypothetical protein
MTTRLCAASGLRLGREGKRKLVMPCPKCGRVVMIRYSNVLAPHGLPRKPGGAQMTATEAERLWEELGGDLCICQRPEVPHWCEGCQIRMGKIAAALAQARAEQFDRVELMASGHESWDLSQNDLAALRMVLAEVAQLRALLAEIDDQDGYHLSANLLADLRAALGQGER